VPASATALDERKAWIYAFAILLIISVTMLIMRVLGKEFLVLDFEVALIYFPTILAGVTAAYVTARAAK
jgi:hypothetical protein